eukprot:CAMPEP_0113956816 /NCGR_PEP_ID=MMETSP0011_2-20120614/2312_1 /TAXON_ID=101924 /ORGANISM="Rhodosorus marinus" /LENGTH=154 /DNA_ID=CAMNT_0000967085 /DNA_START=605 /DNA_END=1066 /DNA_ORIENTATION=- /assembly_acc=CAM_ASM_000156
MSVARTVRNSSAKASVFNLSSPNWTERSPFKQISSDPTGAAHNRPPSHSTIIERRLPLKLESPSPSSDSVFPSESAVSSAKLNHIPAQIAPTNFSSSKYSASGRSCEEASMIPSEEEEAHAARHRYKPETGTEAKILALASSFSLVYFCMSPLR